MPPTTPDAPPDRPLQEIQEAGVQLRVEHVSSERGPARSGDGVFHNPAMAVNRDVSVLALRAWAEPGWRVLDGLAATGARGLRWADAVPDVDVVLNDWSDDAARRIRDHAEANGLADRVTVRQRNLGALCWDERFRWVDVDPFGSPAPFLDAAARSLRRGGILGFTATDTTALCGVYPKPCRRRYAATPLRADFEHEAALRILAGAAVRAAARRDVAAVPVLAHATDHYHRVHARLTPGARRADDALARLRRARACPDCGHRGFLDDEHGDDPTACPACGSGRVRVGGPMWAGPLQDADALDDVLDVLHRSGPPGEVEDGGVPLARPRETSTLVRTLRAEADAPPLLLDVHAEASRAGVGAPAQDDVLDTLAARGFQATPTHVTPVGVRTDATASQLRDVIRELEDG